MVSQKWVRNSHEAVQTMDTEMLLRKNVGNYTFKNVNKISKAISISTCSRTEQEVSRDYSG